VTKILCGGDPHCWYDNYSRPADDGRPSRLVDWIRTGEAMLRLAKDQHVDLVVIPGDLFPNARPSSQAMIAMAQLFTSFELANIPVIACNGNHDIAGPGQPGPVNVLAELGRPRWGITTPAIVDVAGLQVAVLPWAKPSGLLADASGAGDLAARTSAALVDIIRGLGAQVDPAKPAILIGHWAIGGCQTSSGMTISGGEPALPLGDLQAGPWRAVIMGHIHKPQVFPGTPVVLHTGAMERVDFGEEHDPRGCYIVDTETGEVTWHDLPVRRFWTWTISDTGVAVLANAMGTQSLVTLVPATIDAKGAICRIRYRCTEDQAKRIDNGALVRVLEEAGAYHVAGVYPEIIRADRSRAEGLTERTSPLEALDTWMAMKTDVPLDIKSAARAAAEQLLQEVL
jgi:exonuclease SbcC